jgi:putative ABC transport system substrate-binding protein
MEIIPVVVERPTDVDSVLRSIPSSGAEFVFDMSGGLADWQHLARTLQDQRIPWLWFGQDPGAVVSYHANLVDVVVRGADYIDRILRGAEPQDLPVLRPATYDLYVNLRTARTLGVTVAPSVIRRATRVVE